MCLEQWAGKVAFGPVASFLLLTYCVTLAKAISLSGPQPPSMKERWLSDAKQGVR